MRYEVELSEVKLLWVKTIVSQAVVSQAIAAQTIVGWVVKTAASMRGEVVTDREYLTISQVIYDWAS